VVENKAGQLVVAASLPVALFSYLARLSGLSIPSHGFAAVGLFCPRLLLSIISFYHAMKRKRFSFSLWSLAAIVAIALACNKEKPIAPPSDTEPAPQQYGTPFDKVPEIADIQMYEVNPRVFSPTKNLAGITARLDSLRKLGINVVWLMPIHQTGSVKSVGSPYAVKDYLSIHADYGDLADLRALVDEAHRLEMAVIMDWVANHTAWDHDWISNKSWYAQDAQGNIIHPPGTNWQDVAELNYNNQAMRREMIRAMKYWVLEANIDGYRCDFASGAPLDFWQQAIDTLRSIPEREIIMFAESDDKALLSVGFDIIFGWPFYGRLKEVFGGLSARQLYNRHLTEYNGLAPGQHVLRWITNHDEHAWDATPQNIFGGNRAAMAAFILASHIGGIPLLYNGQEVGVPYQLPFFEGSNVTINWGLNPQVKAEYERVLNFRKSSDALRRGIVTDHSSASVAAFVRAFNGAEVLVLVNVRNTSSTLSLPASLAHTAWFDAYGQLPVQLGATVTLSAYEYKVLKN
jgi:glycosidase